ncbi:hypothetical protein J7M23_12280, partial [Candidatus Sumerlaeota bacterium]|nr:hypothetical protein [Candidatus Sumerlaeota bacterium]
YIYAVQESRFISQLPQLLKKFNYKYINLSAPNPICGENPSIFIAGDENGAFMWEALDGSTMLTYSEPHFYKSNKEISVGQDADGSVGIFYNAGWHQLTTYKKGEYLHYTLSITADKKIYLKVRTKTGSLLVDEEFLNRLPALNYLVYLFWAYPEAEGKIKNLKITRGSNVILSCPFSQKVMSEWTTEIGAESVRIINGALCVQKKSQNMKGLRLKKTLSIPFEIEFDLKVISGSPRLTLLSAETIAQKLRVITNAPDIEGVPGDFTMVELFERIPASQKRIKLEPNDLVFDFYQPWGINGDKLIKLHKDTEVKISSAEALSCLARRWGLYDFQKQIEFLWKPLLISQNHDPQYCAEQNFGVAIGQPVYWAAFELAKMSKQLAELSINKLLDELTAEIDTKGHTRVCVFNPLVQSAEKIASLEITEPMLSNDIILLDGKKVYSTQIVDKRLLFKCSLPALGWKCFSVAKTQRKSNLNYVKSSDEGFIFDNDYFRISFDKKGRVKELIEHRTQKKLFGAQNSFGVLTIEDKSEIPISAFVESQGPVRAVIVQKGTIKGLPYEKHYLLYPEFNHIDILVRVGEKDKKITKTLRYEDDIEDLAGRAWYRLWHNFFSSLKLAFKPDFQGEVYFNQPFCVVKLRAGKKLAYPERWLVYKNDSLGITLINYGTQGYLINKNEIANLLVSSASYWLGDYIAEGVCQFKQTVVIHSGNWQWRRIIQRVAGIYYPVFARWVNNTGGELPATFSLVKANAKNSFCFATYPGEGAQAVFYFSNFSDENDLITVRLNNDTTSQSSVFPLKPWEFKKIELPISPKKESLPEGVIYSNLPYKEEGREIRYFAPSLAFATLWNPESLLNLRGEKIAVEPCSQIDLNLRKVKKGNESFYTSFFELTGEYANVRLWLRFTPLFPGNRKELIKIYVNNRRVAWDMDITSLVHSGKNEIKIITPIMIDSGIGGFKYKKKELVLESAQICVGRLWRREK